MKNYFDFKGTAKRQEYWAVFIASIVMCIIGIVITETIPLVALVVLVVTLWVYVATTVRRLRDADLHLAWIIILFIPYIATVAAVVFGIVGSADKKED
jgi:uncharacterized membrane protein YhaH (DUF805 family)